LNRDVFVYVLYGIQVVGLRRTTEEYAKALDRARVELLKETLSPEERTEVQKSIEIFSAKLEEQARHMAWIQSAVFTVERQQLVFQLLKQLLVTLNGSTHMAPPNSDAPNCSIHESPWYAYSSI
jgi:hypothetical protein